MWLEQAAADALDQLDAANRRRRLRAVAVPGPRLVLADGRRLIDASSNDYLGLSQHPALKARAIEWVERFGAGMRASRRVTARSAFATTTSIISSSCWPSGPAIRDRG